MRGMDFNFPWFFFVSLCLIFLILSGFSGMAELNKCTLTELHNIIVLLACLTGCLSHWWWLHCEKDRRPYFMCGYGYGVCDFSTAQHQEILNVDLRLTSTFPQLITIQCTNILTCKHCHWMRNLAVRSTEVVIEKQWVLIKESRKILIRTS